MLEEAYVRIEKMNYALIEARSVAENARQLKAEFAANISHELRTPLTILRGRLEGIIDKVYPADEEHIAPVLEETYMLERVIDDLHLLSLAEARQLHFDLTQVDLGESARRAVSSAVDFEAACRRSSCTWSA